MGGTLVIGASIQLIAYALTFWKPPFLVFGSSFFFAGLGVAFLDAQVNTYVAHMRNSHRWLGVLHAAYGLGALLSPIAATTFATKTPYWHLFYLLMLVLTLCNIAWLSWSFRDSLFKPSGDAEGEDATDQLKAALSQQSVWMISLFFFLYVGAEVTAGGMSRHPKIVHFGDANMLRLGHRVPYRSATQSPQYRRLRRVWLLGRPHDRAYPSC